MYYKGQVFLIVGLSSSGLYACRSLLRRGARCLIYDDSLGENVMKNKSELTLNGAKDVTNLDIPTYINEADIVVLSPGVPIDSQIPVYAKRMKKRIIGETELGFMLIKSPLIAVTGTNGKTTTCSLIASILSKAGFNNYLVGNVGTPLCQVEEELTENVLGVCEISSFQLETVKSFCPHIAVILNVTPDHLTRHYNMENYIYLKGRILANMRESEFAVLNYDDETVRHFKEKARCKIVWFSKKETVDGVYCIDGKIYYKGEFVALRESVPLSGEHNVDNFLAAVAVCKLFNVSSEDIVNAVRSFSGVSHRIELINEFGEKRYYNDSKATNADATEKAVETMKEATVLILGGKNKGLSYKNLFEKLKATQVVHVVLTGETRFNMFNEAKEVGYDKLTVASSFESAVRFASVECPKGGNVLLSPACSSFDNFSSFEERGKVFTKIVSTIKEEYERAD